MSIEYIAVDTETTGLDLFHNAAPFMVGTITDEGTYRTWEWEVDPFTRKIDADSPSRAELRDYLQGKKLIFHHAKFDLRALSRIGIIIHADNPKISVMEPSINDDLLYMAVDVPEIHDTQLLSHVVNSQGTGDSKSDLGRHALKPLALYYLDIAEGDQKDLRAATISARRAAKKLGWKLGTSLDGESQIATDYWMPKAIANLRLDDPTCPDSWRTLCEKYCLQDCYRTIGLFFFLQEIMRRDKLEKNYERELRLLPVTYNMEHVGLHAPSDNLESTYAFLSTKATELKARAEAILCETAEIKELNVNSGPLQLAPALIKSGVPLANRTNPSKKFPSGQWATDASTLRELAQWCESPSLHSKSRPEKIVKAGEALRLICGWNGDDGDVDENGDKLEQSIPGYKTYETGTNYVSGYRFRLDRLSCVHPSYNQVGTAWTRYSSSDPNGQNVSKKAVLPLRRAFGPPPGYVWFAIDYSQLELRIYAFATNDQGLIKSFEEGYDFHTFTAMNMFDLPADKISSEQRRSAKYVNFGVVFGAGAPRIDFQSGKPGTYQMYMDKFPNAKKAMAKILKQVESNGYVLTLSGYKLYVPEEKPYAGMNAVVQGTAGDIVKQAMIDIHEMQLVDWARPTKELPYGGSSIVANIHDELLIQIPTCYPYKAIARRIIKVMENAGTKLGMVTPCDAKLITTNWAEGEKFECIAA